MQELLRKHPWNVFQLEVIQCEKLSSFAEGDFGFTLNFVCSICCHNLSGGVDERDSVQFNKIFGHIFEINLYDRLAFETTWFSKYATMIHSIQKSFRTVDQRPV